MHTMADAGNEIDQEEPEPGMGVSGKYHNWMRDTFVLCIFHQLKFIGTLIYSLRRIL